MNYSDCRYFGAAKNLPEVKALLKKEPEDVITNYCNVMFRYLEKEDMNCITASIWIIMVFEMRMMERY